MPDLYDGRLAIILCHTVSSRSRACKASSEVPLAASSFALALAKSFHRVASLAAIFPDHFPRSVAAGNGKAVYIHPFPATNPDSYQKVSLKLPPPECLLTQKRFGTNAHCSEWT